MKKPTIEQIEKLKTTIRTLYQLENELSDDFEGNRQDAKNVHSLLNAADQLVTVYEKWWKENK